MNIYDIVDLILAKLSSNPALDIKLEIDDDIFVRIRNLLSGYKLFPNYEAYNLVKIDKCDDLAQQYREKGNDFFRKRKFFSALCAYNKSICFSKAHSENMGLAFANRSAVFYEIDEPHLCHANITLAKHHKYPSEKLLKLEERDKKCKASNSIKPKTSKLLQLTHKVNPKYPFIINCLSLKLNKEFGRHVVTTNILKAGNVIAIEPHFNGILLSDQVFKRCTNCLGQFNLNLLPCEHCVSAMFCSQHCKDEANKKFHKYECDMNLEGIGKFFTVAVRASMRTFIEALFIFDGIERLKNFLKEHKDIAFTAFDVDKSSSDQTYHQQLFMTLCSLCSNEERRSTVENFRRAIVCVILYEYLILNSSLQNILRSDENGKFFMNFMFKHIQIAESNFHELYSLKAEKMEQSNEQFGVGSFPFASLLNHSCLPNVFRLSSDGLNYVIVARHIEKGEQIFDNYGYHHSIHTLQQRRNGLVDRYQFNCCCDACVNNFPLFEELLEKDKDFDTFISNDLEEFEKFNTEKAERAIKRYSKYIENHDKNIPSYEITLIQECMLRCFRILERSKSMFNLNFIET
ncbi:CLUMA_CG005209, isoform A [Clunio marinus]|uniref:CLUMA_CG005209, isoform A n=1 Tax=Clunio marinus TaxID=568069 RepID=A0A1J1HU05_9DIPT|nr:CLUMA_CG005209, isoform A [Clunio marinus]